MESLSKEVEIYNKTKENNGYINIYHRYVIDEVSNYFFHILVVTVVGYG